MASEVKSDLRFEISDLNYPYIHVHILPFKSQFLDLRGHCRLQTALEVQSDLGFEISDPKKPIRPKFRGTFVIHFRNLKEKKSICS